MTRIESRKFLNIESNALVSMVITDEKAMETVQLSGAAERVHNLADESASLTELWTADHSNSNWPGPAVKLYEAGHSVQLAVVRVTPSELSFASFIRTKGHTNSFFDKVI